MIEGRANKVTVRRLSYYSAILFPLLIVSILATMSISDILPQQQVMAQKTTIPSSHVGGCAVDITACFTHSTPTKAAATQLPPSSKVGGQTAATAATIGTTTNVITQQSAPLLSSLSNLFKNAENSVVQITTTTHSTNLSNPNNTQTIIDGKPVQNFNSQVNAGFIYDKNGHILTPASIVQSANLTAGITFVDGDSYSAKVIGKDLESNLAVLQLDKSVLTQEKIQPLPILSNSSSLEVGQPVAVIGSPFGLFPSLTTGLISALNRLVPIPGTTFSIPGTIQIDGIINSGDSGPVLNLDGKVIGLMSLIYLGNNNTFTGINFAVSSNTIQKIVPQLIAHGIYRHPYLGISGATITLDIARAMGIKNNRTEGVIVESVTPGSPAAAAGIKNGTKSTTVNGRLVSTNGDIVVGIDNKQVRKMNDIIDYIDTKSASDTVILKVLRDGIIRNIDVKLTERPITASNTTATTPANTNTNNSTSTGSVPPP